VPCAALLAVSAHFGPKRVPGVAEGVARLPGDVAPLCKEEVGRLETISRFAALVSLFPLAWRRDCAPESGLRGRAEEGPCVYPKQSFQN